MMNEKSPPVAPAMSVLSAVIPWTYGAFSPAATLPTTKNNQAGKMTRAPNAT